MLIDISSPPHLLHTAACLWCRFRYQKTKDSPGQRIVESVERDGRRDPLDAELSDVIVREEAKADLVHSMANYGPVMRHVGLAGPCLAYRRLSTVDGKGAASLLAHDTTVDETADVCARGRGRRAACTAHAPESDGLVTNHRSRGGDWM